MTTLVFEFVLPMEDATADLVFKMKRSALRKGWAVTSAYEPGLARNAFIPRLFVRLQKEEPVRHIVEPIGRVFAAGIVQYGTRGRAA